MTLAWPFTAGLLRSRTGTIGRAIRGRAPISCPGARQTRGVSRPTGLTHVATVSFLASRAAPAAQFWLALGGGLALARAAREQGARTGFGAALAAMLQTVA